MKELHILKNFTLINSDIKNIQNLALSLIFHYDLEDKAKEFLAKIPKIKLENLKKFILNLTYKQAL